MSFVKQSAATFITQLAIVPISLATGVMVARVLGPSLKGQAALLSNLIQLLFMFGSLGLGSAFSFFIAKKKYPPRAIMSFAVAAALLIGGLLNILFYITWPFHAKIWNGIPMYLILLSTSLSVFLIYSTYLERIMIGHGRIYSVNAANMARTVTNFTAVVVLLCVWSMRLFGVIIVLWSGVLAQLLVSIWVLRGDMVPSPFWKAGLMRSAFSYGLKSHALILINFLNYRLDIFILQYLTRNSSEVGYYSLAVGMAELMWLVPNSTAAPLFSGVASSEADDRSVITLLTCRWSLILLAVLALAGVLLGKYFIQLLYGAAYIPSFGPFVYLLPGVCLFPLFKLLAVDLAARGFPGYGTIASAVALLVNVIANIVLIPGLGGRGAALATSISYTLMAAISVFFFVRITGHSLRELFWVEKKELRLLWGRISAMVAKIRKGPNLSESRF